MKEITDLQDLELHTVTGGDWVDTTWGFMLGAAATAGFLGSGGMLGLAFGAGGLLLMDGWVF
jgi:hypothetical protein